jgi:L,D-peptidoglycan transpeptidase YkuD (ErfK/YbiS/YcfS/YnhG family)
MRYRYPPMICVFASPLNRSKGILVCGPLRFPCALGRNGVTYFKKEGDGATPRSQMRILCGFYRADRIPHPQTRIPLKKIKPDQGWCDDPAHRLYNRPVTLPFRARHEVLRRDDHAYDIVLDVSWNRAPILKGKGSAIFLHLAREGLTATEGCIALGLKDMKKLLRVISRHRQIRVR